MANSSNRKQKRQFAIKFDKLLYSELFTDERRFVILDDSEMKTIPLISRYEKKLYMLFIIKLYSCSFSIQQYLVQSLIDYNHNSTYDRKYCIVNNLLFSFNAEWIERIYSLKFSMEHVFLDQTDRLESEIDHFYQNIWPIETENLKDWDLCLLIECYKLCLWWKIDGSNLQIFRQILNLFKQMVNDCVSRGYNLFIKEFAFINNLQMNSESRCLVKDQIAQDIVKSVCFCLNKIVYSLIKSLWKVAINPDLKILKKISLGLVRPGMIEFISTIDVVLGCLDRLMHLFIVYNDQFDTIKQSIESTKLIIIALYRDLFCRITFDWYCQIRTIMERVKYRSDLKLNIILHFSLIIEMHFIVRFNQTFRFDYYEFQQMMAALNKYLHSYRKFDFVK